MRNRSVLALAVSAFAVLAAGCDDKPKPTAPPEAAAPVVRDAGAPMRRVAVLVTGHETGHLVTAAPRLIAQWTRDEKWPDAIALSTGDLFSGISISSHFFGQSTAEVAKALQYRAAALGNHELDLGLKTFKEFRTASGVTFLAANLKDRPNAEEPLALEAFTVIEREGVKVGVVGLTSEKTVKTTLAGRAAGLELVPTETVLPAAIEGAKKAGADAVVVLIDDCFTGLSKQFEAHPDWKVDLVVGSRCDEANEAKVNGVPFFSVGDDVSFYVSAVINLKADGQREVKVARTALVQKIAEDQDLIALRDRWQKKLDEELGQVIGFSKNGLKEEDMKLRTLVATALKEQTKSDAAIINKKGIRAELPKGPITKASIYSLIPFENAVVTGMVKGEVLEKLKANPEAVFVGPAKLEKTKDYQLVSVEYLYFGGDGLGFEAAAPNPEITGQVWQTPVVEWLLKQQTSEKKPLEKVFK